MKKNIRHRFRYWRFTSSDRILSDICMGLDPIHAISRTKGWDFERREHHGQDCAFVIVPLAYFGRKLIPYWVIDAL